MNRSWSKSPKTIALICAGVINALLIYLLYRDFSTIPFLGIFNVSLVVIFFWRKSFLVRAGLFVAAVPIICAFLYSLLNGGSMFDENTGGGGYLWLLIISLPIGLMLIAIGVIVGLARRSKP